MSDIKGQLIKDSYNYVLQADIATGVVYRIGGAVPTNPIFQSGLTINQSFNYSDGSQQNGYVLTSDAGGNASWQPISAATPSSGVTSITVSTGLSANSSTGAVTIVFTGSTGTNFTGGTVSGATIFTDGLSANTISATTYYNLPIDIRVTGGTYSSGTATFTNNTGGTFSVSGFSTGTSVTQGITGVTGNNGLSASTTNNVTTIGFSGGNISNPTNFTNGVTANTLSLGSTPSLMTTTAVTVSTGTNNVYSVPTTPYNSFHIDYNISGSSGLRAGSIVAIWDGSNVDYTDTSTNDIGNTTPVSFLVSLSGGNAILQASVTTSTWRIKTIIRTI
jgi:hypothetical protein